MDESDTDQCGSPAGEVSIPISSVFTSMGSASERDLDADNSITPQHSSQIPSQSGQQNPSTKGHWRCALQPSDSDQSEESCISNDNHRKLTSPEMAATDIMENECLDDSKIMQNDVETNCSIGSQLETEENSSNSLSNKPSKRKLDQVMNISNNYNVTYDSDCDSIGERDRLEQEVLEEWDQVIHAEKAEDQQKPLDEVRELGREDHEDDGANTALDLAEAKSRDVRSQLGVPMSMWNDELRDLEKEKNSLVKTLKRIANQRADKNTENDTLQETRAKVDELEATIISQLTSLRMKLLQNYTEEKLRILHSKQMESSTQKKKKGMTLKEKRRAKKMRQKIARQAQRKQEEEINSAAAKTPNAKYTCANKRTFILVDIADRKGLAGDFPDQFGNQTRPLVVGSMEKSPFPGRIAPSRNNSGGNFLDRRDNQKRPRWADDMIPSHFPGPSGPHRDIPPCDFPDRRDQNWSGWEYNGRNREYPGPRNPNWNAPTRDFLCERVYTNRPGMAGNMRHAHFLGPNGPHGSIPDSEFPGPQGHQNRPDWEDNMRHPEFPSPNGLRCNVPPDDFSDRHGYRHWPAFTDNMRHLESPGPNVPHRNVPPRNFPGRRHDNQNWSDRTDKRRHPEFPGPNGPDCNVPARDFSGPRDYKNRPGMASNTRHPGYRGPNGPHSNMPLCDLPGQHDNPNLSDYAQNSKRSKFPDPTGPQCNVPGVPPSNNNQIDPQDLLPYRDPSEPSKVSIFGARPGKGLCRDSPFGPIMPDFVCSPPTNISHCKSPPTALPKRPPATEMQPLEKKTSSEKKNSKKNLEIIPKEEYTDATPDGLWQVVEKEKLSLSGNFEEEEDFMRIIIPPDLQFSEERPLAETFADKIRWQFNCQGERISQCSILELEQCLSDGDSCDKDNERTVQKTGIQHQCHENFGGPWASETEIVPKQLKFWPLRDLRPLLQLVETRKRFFTQKAPLSLSKFTSERKLTQDEVEASDREIETKLQTTNLATSISSELLPKTNSVYLKEMYVPPKIFDPFEGSCPAVPSASALEMDIFGFQ